MKKQVEQKKGADRSSLCVNKNKMNSDKASSQ